MEQTIELLKAIGSLLTGLGAALTPIAAVVIALIGERQNSKHKKRK